MAVVQFEGVLGDLCGLVSGTHKKKSEKPSAKKESDKSIRSPFGKKWSKANLSTFWFSYFGPFLVMAPKG